jgi:hypothetical protein
MALIQQQQLDHPRWRLQTKRRAERRDLLRGGFETFYSGTMTVF